MLLYFGIHFIFWSFIPDRAVPATHIVVCNKVHPYSFTAGVTCAKREPCRYKLQCACLTGCSQINNHR